MKYFEISWILIILFVPISLGIVHSIHDIDPHHWGFITGTTWEFIQGKSLYDEIYILYGVGQPIFYKLVNYFVSINYTSIGIITSFVYAINLMTLYFGIKKISNITYAIILSGAALSFHSYSIYPWPDYYSGLCLTIACFFIIGESQPTTKKTSYRPYLIGLLLCVSMLFRNTNLISYLCACVSYLALAIFIKPIRNKSIQKAIYSYCLFFISYFVFLYFQGKLHLWYGQNFDLAKNQYGINNEFISAIFRIFLLPTFDKLNLTNNLITISFSLLFYAGIFTVLFSVFKGWRQQGGKDQNYGAAVFIAFLGLAGISQGAYIYSVFRVQNACLPLFFSFTYFIVLFLPDAMTSINKKILYLFLLIYFGFAYSYFPSATTFFPILDHKIDSYTVSNIPFFGYHRFQKESHEYYSDLSKHICDGHSKILNLTMDSSIPYLCSNQKSALNLPFFDDDKLNKISPQKLAEIEKGEFQSDEIIISDYHTIPRNPLVKLILLGEASRPQKTRFIGAGKVKIFRVENKILKK